MSRAELALLVAYPGGLGADVALPSPVDAAHDTFFMTLHHRGGRDQRRLFRQWGGDESSPGVNGAHESDTAEAEEDKALGTHPLRGLVEPLLGPIAARVAVGLAKEAVAMEEAGSRRETMRRAQVWLEASRLHGHDYIDEAAARLFE